MTRTDTPHAWDERTTLLTMLQYTRDTAAEKCRDLAEEQVGRALLETSPLMTLGGVVNHMRWVEHSWIENRFVGGPDLGPWTEQEPDREFSLGATTPLAQTLREYAEQAARTDAIIAGLALDDRSATPFRSGERPTLRWVMLHLVEENARHNGHLDILRELADGRTGS
ncbi:putative damage-inducible protein DinB [Phycicoccus badiiscoriae]|uniref:Putative damage-inducible protein DinB n=1 Tax=Pedococcus badiiscoriae TaxID=642776 RepID=A0A852WBI3_9MICO|nr:DinB family protein [Pedococcus badiiscoriae]NYG06418.1 putative damage-inducible protein DinB [Pedococcus badiiscoriae]